MSDECIVWTGAKAGAGYGVTSKNGKQAYVHRLAAEDAYGPIPPGMVVSHRCDNPACYNPAHLRICTQAENLLDMRQKGRAASGSKHRSRTHPELVLRGEMVGTSKLTEAQVQEIRSKYSPGSAGKRSEHSLAGLARQYGVTFQTIHKIVKGLRWKKA